MLIEILGEDYVVWDKGCTIRFKRPARETVFADFQITPEMLDEVRRQVEANGEYTFTWKIEYKNQAGTVFAEFDKVLYAATKTFYKEKQKKRELKNQSTHS